MTANQFKALGRIVSNWVDVDFVAKKEILGWFGSYDDGEWECMGDDDTHVAAIMDGQTYCDGEVTPEIARRAQYLEQSHAEGYMFWVSPKCDEGALADVAESNVMWHVENREAWHELDAATETRLADILN